MRSIAWTSNHPRKKSILTTNSSTPNPFYNMAKLPARNYCDDDLDTIYNPKDWFDDQWWRL